MLHKISEFCDKIDSIKLMSDRLRDMKYGKVKANDSEIDNMIPVSYTHLTLPTKA